MYRLLALIVTNKYATHDNASDCTVYGPFLFEEQIEQFKEQYTKVYAGAVYRTVELKPGTDLPGKLGEQDRISSVEKCTAGRGGGAV